MARTDCTLKHGQVTNGLGHFLDGLHSGRTGTDDRDAPTVKNSPVR
jgi:hypothetical protein